MSSVSGTRSTSSLSVDVPRRLSDFRNLLRTGNPIPSMDAREASLENAAGAVADLSDAGIKHRLGVTSEQLRRVVKEQLGGGQDLLDIADEIVRGGDNALKGLAQDDAAAFRADPELLANLETVVRLDGSRPSFMVRNGEVDLTTSPVGGWAEVVATSQAFLKKALACVGRIDLPAAVQGFEGTGFLIQRDLVLTNRHVLQLVADPSPAGWVFRPGACIDFGHEFRADMRHPCRALRRVVYCGPDAIDLRAPADHWRLDLALLELEPPAAADAPVVPLSVDASTDWADEGTYVFAAGYPGRPPFGLFNPTLMEQLFQSTFGCKRLAPGTAAKRLAAAPDWTMAHDVTTLGGNSGSVVLVVGRETASAALHYGGERRPPRENWAHVLGGVLDVPADVDGPTLRELLVGHGVDLVDRRVGTSAAASPTRA